MIRTLLRQAFRIAALAAVFAALTVDGAGAGAGDGGLLAAKTMTPKPGTVFRDCPQCPELIVVPAGIFVMGSNKTRKTEKPAHRVNFKRPFAIGRFEVTFDQWLACVAEKGCRHRPHDHNWGRKSRPVINITWDQAKNYLKWLSRKTGQTYRLPSEAEWEYVHRAGTRSKFWWGDETGSKMANCRDCESKQCCSAKDHSCCSHETKPVGTFGANPFGVFDTAGNAFEWVEDCWNADHRGAPSDGTARKTGNCRFRVIRGRSFYYFSKVSQGTYRAKNPPGVKSYWLGFRVLRELP